MCDGYSALCGIVLMSTFYFVIFLADQALSYSGAGSSGGRNRTVPTEHRPSFHPDSPRANVGPGKSTGSRCPAAGVPCAELLFADWGRGGRRRTARHADLRTVHHMRGYRWHCRVSGLLGHLRNVVQSTCNGCTWEWLVYSVYMFVVP